MKLKPIIFSVLFIVSIFLLISCNNLNRNQFTFKLENSDLIINKDEWKIQFDGEGQQFFEDTRPFQFLIEDNWVSVSSVNSIETSDSSGTIISLLLENGSKAEMELTEVSDFAVRMKIKPLGLEATACRGFIELDPVEEIYGFGETWNGRVAQRGSIIDIWAKNGTPDECAYMPYYVSTKNYALFVNYGGRVIFDVGQKRADELVFEAQTGQMEIMLVSGDKISSVVQNFLTEL